jgi:flagellar biosynthesis protein FliR
MNKKRLKLTIGQTLAHYGVVLFLSMPVLFQVKYLFETYITHTYTISSVGSFGWNERNVETFIKNFDNVLNNVTEELQLE